MKWRRSSETEPSPQSQALGLQAASLLLGYPDEQLLARLPLLERVAPALPSPSATLLRACCAYLAHTPLVDLQPHYTETFDLRRRCCLYLTYFSHGDTRQRGMALLRFRSVYKAAGVELGNDELPDHLAVVCEFAGTADLAGGLGLLREHRAGIELVRTALAEAGSAYVDVLDLVRGLLPDPGPTDLELARELALTGPPEEQVGIEAFGPPELMGGRR